MRRAGKLALVVAAATILASGVVGTMLLGACGSTSVLNSNDGGGLAETAACPARVDAPPILPNVSEAHRTAGYWIALADDADAEILTAQGVNDHNAALAHHDLAHPNDDPLGRYDLAAPENERRLEKDIQDRLVYMRDRIGDGRYVDADGKPLNDAAKAAFSKSAKVVRPGRDVHRAEQDTPLRCGPRDAPLYAGPKVDHAFDRNSCSTIRKGELVRVIADWGGGLRLVRTPYAMGWIGAAAKLSAPLADVQAALHQPARPITRRAILEQAFSYLGKPYGWGGQGGGRDCSRFIMDVFGTFGLELPRHSGLQAKAGSMAVDISKLAAAKSDTAKPDTAKSDTAKSDTAKLDVAGITTGERLSLIDAAQERGAVLLHFPGHIMLYLGRSREGTPMAIHAFAEYLEKCGAGGETLRVVDRIQVSDLSLGAGTSRRSFLERVTHITIIGQTPGPKLFGAVARRPPAPMHTASTRTAATQAPQPPAPQPPAPQPPAPQPAAPQPPPPPAARADVCSDSEEVAIFTSPRRPHVGAPLRVIVSSAQDLGPVAIEITDAAGQRHVPALHTNGGPPFGYWVEIPAPSPTGKWSVRIGDGSRVAACETFQVHDEGDARQASGGSVWRPRLAWDEATENLFATFIERLFDYPLDDSTWSNLQQLLGNRDNNLLHNHLGQAEDETLSLRPDCADLPYFLRAYFSWKMRLPFAYRHCNRGSKGKAPYCDRELHSALSGVEASSEVGAFALFARDNVANGVHSGSGRAEVDSNDTDYYPLPITREAIRPGTIFADPYGHLFVIADWVPQGIGTYGILVGADAQPDGTIGRRRFWPGSFLFSPETTEAAAGFKAFRPVRFSGGRVRQLKNADITTYSREQYAGTAQEFYDKVEALINPRPLDPHAMLEVLATALHEQVKRRVVSVQNAIDYKAGRSGAIDMPHGHSLFETTGAWEDFSTPSRDMRLLIAMDTVVGFPAAVERNPQRFGVSGATGPVVAALQKSLATALSKRSFSYTNSAGNEVTLTLQDVVDRAKGFEMAYNPNDCVELRWAAPAESTERASCRVRAPQHQTAEMTRNRAWFANRKRPSR